MGDQSPLRAALVVLLLILPSVLQRVAAAGEQCSTSQQCPKSSPCCGAGGTCGSGALQCAGGCQPMASFSASSCLANPVCSSKNLTLAPTDYNNPHTFWPILLYNGNATKAPFTLDYGYLGKGPEGVLLELTAATQTKISTTDYMLYGSVQLEARHNALTGLVFAFITMSDTKDEIDWEFTTSSGSDLQTNYFSQGKVATGTASSINAPSNNFDVSDWHTYGLNWQPNQLQWLIDGNVVRTVSRNQGGANYPRSPSRIQISTWAGGNSTNPPGVIQWSGGAIDWTSQTYTSQGFYSAEIRSFTTNCADQSTASVNTIGNGTAVTSYVYTGQTSSTLNEPEYVMSRNPITYLKNPDDDSTPGLPGYSTQSAFTQSNKNAWDGSGDTSGLSSQEISGKSGSSNSGGWLANNRALSIAVPVIAAIAVLAALWASIVWCCRRRHRDGRHNELGHGVVATSGVPLREKLTSAAALGNKSDEKASRYQALRGGADDGEDEDAMTPMGARRQGRGYGPAPGPRPGPMDRQEWSDSSSSLYDHTPYHGVQPSYGMNDYYTARSPAPRAMTAGMTPQPMGGSALGVRGPYTPGLNAYTPTVHQQSPAMSSFTPQMSSYGAPQYTNHYGQGQPLYGQSPQPNYPGRHGHY